MNTLLTTENIGTFIAVRRDGVIYLVERAKMISERTTFDTLFENELKELNFLSRSGKISSGERTYRRESIIVDTAIKRYTKGLIEIDTR